MSAKVIRMAILSFAVALFLGASAILMPAWAQVAAPGYAVINFATGFVSSSGVGPAGIAMDASGNLYVGDIVTGYIYKFGPAGGVASTATQLATPSSLGGHTPHGLAFGKDGNLYLNLIDAGEVVQLDPINGTIVRIVASGVQFASALATDPLSGDLFVSQSGGGSTIFRVSNFASGPGTVTVYAIVPFADGLAFGPDGTLYAAAAGLGGVVAISGTNSPPPTPSTWTLIASVPGGLDGMAVSAKPNVPFVYTNNNNGTIAKVDLSTTPPTLANIFSGGSRGDFATVGSDGCLYATQTDRVIKVTNADGTCFPPPLGPLLPTLPSSCVAPPPGIVSWWPGEGNANDIVDGNNGTLVGGATFAPGLVGEAFSFGGVDGSVGFGNTVGNFGTSDFTVDFWIKTSSTRTEGILGKRPICSHSSFWDIRLLASKLVIELDQDTAGTNYNEIFSNAVVNDGKWHLVAVVRSGTTMSVYVDGVLDSTGTTAGITNITNSADLRAGTSTCTGIDGTAFFTGLVDEIEIYNRALSRAEIQAVFKAGSAGKCVQVTNQPPVAMCKNVTVSADATCRASASVDNGSSDPDGDKITLTQSPSGPYSLGGTGVMLSATDPAGLQSSCQATVTVVDTTPPSITCPAAQRVECTGAMSSVALAATATDNCGVRSTSCSPGQFPLGRNTATCTATDSSGNTATCQVSVTIVDTTPPSISSVTASPNVLWSPNHEIVPVAVGVAVTDACDPNVANSCQIVSVASNEPINGPGDGNTAPDYQITGKLTLNLRAERSGTGDGRVYTVAVACTDASGNSSQKTVAVTVPHDQGN